MSTCCQTPPGPPHSLQARDWKQDKPRCMKPSSPKLGQCFCPAKPGPPSGNMYVSEMMNQFNGAQRHDPQLLQDHIKCNHPHLIKKIPPYALLENNLCGGDQSSDDDLDVGGCAPIKMGCGGGSRSGSQSPKSSRGRGDKRCGVPGSRSRTGSPRSRSRSPGCGGRGGRGRGKARGTAPPKQRGNVYEAYSDLKHTAGGGVNLPPTQRYDFYRYFGYAGQGAKTSKGWNSVKIPWTKTPLDAQSSTRCHSRSKTK